MGLSVRQDPEPPAGGDGEAVNTEGMLTARGERTLDRWILRRLILKLESLMQYNMSFHYSFGKNKNFLSFKLFFSGVSAE